MQNRSVKGIYPQASILDDLCQHIFRGQISDLAYYPGALRTHGVWHEFSQKALMRNPSSLALVLNEASIGVDARVIRSVAEIGDRRVPHQGVAVIR